MIAKSEQGHSAESGFSLLEVLVAFSIMAISMAILLRVLFSSEKMVRLERDYTNAILIANSLLESAGEEIPMTQGFSSGEVSNYYRWKMHIAPYPIETGTVSNGAAPPSKLNWVNLTVEWGSGQDLRAHTIKTLRFATPPP